MNIKQNADGTGSIVANDGTELARYSTQRVVAGTTDTLSASDNDRTIVYTSASAVAVTVPAGLGSAFECMILQDGAGQVTLTAGAGVTINNRNAFTKTAAQYAAISLVARATADNYVLAGDGA